MIDVSEDYSSQKVTPVLVKEIEAALNSVKGYGSVEIYIQDSRVTQITTRSIKKTSAKPKKV